MADLGMQSLAMAVRAVAAEIRRLVETAGVLITWTVY